MGRKLILKFVFVFFMIFFVGCTEKNDSVQTEMDPSIRCELAGTRVGLVDEPVTDSVVRSYSIISEKIHIYQDGKFKSIYHIEKKIVNGKASSDFNDTSDHLLNGYLPETVLISIEKEIKKADQIPPIFEYDLSNSSIVYPVGVNEVIRYVDQVMKRETPTM